MSHFSKIAFIAQCSEILKPLVCEPKVLEIGSFDVNGSIRGCFAWASDYTGIDLVSGPGVDAVCSGHEYGERNQYDIVLSCECFEHNPFWLETFINMIKLTKPLGYVVFTCATTGRPEHGTTRTDIGSNPGGVQLQSDYYRNLTKKDFTKKLNLGLHFSQYAFFTTAISKDLLFFGVKRPWKIEQTNTVSEADILAILDKLKSAVNQINQNIPKKPHDFPVLGRLNESFMTLASQVLSDKTYQDFRLIWIRLTHTLAGSLPRW